MKAVLLVSYGDSDTYSVTDVPEPQPKEGQVLVDLHAATINPFDIALARGIHREHIPLNLPVIAGGDFAGVVSKAPHGSLFKQGDMVFGTAIVLNGSSGGWAEKAAVNPKNMAVFPGNLTYEEAAALPLIGSSVVQAIEEHLKLKAGNSILITGGGGGIGHIAIQLAKYIGAHVATTVGTEDVGFAKSLGADEVIDYKKEFFTEKLSGFDAVLDTVSVDNANQSLKVLKKGGTLVSMTGAPDDKLTSGSGIKTIAQNTKTVARYLVKVAEYATLGKIKPNIEKIFPLENISEAAELQKTHPQGKVVLKIR